ncbi:uncharacterized protein LOC128235227 [Mya arenaria]|uniref:uncharacterized protein LOC128235227 n=1 Tax=Mya arenaria TaxID=6604 RepID=UPI0022E06905|nr:uncharacterized protein LOC128235227 [Mya arenaria]
MPWDIFNTRRDMCPSIFDINRVNGFPLRKMHFLRHNCNPYACPTKATRRNTTQAKWVRTLDLSGYDPDNINVSVENDEVRVQACKTRRNPNGISEMTRRVMLPRGVDSRKLKCFLRSDGRLALKAPLRNATTNKSQELKCLQLKEEISKTNLSTDIKTSPKEISKQECEEGKDIEMKSSPVAVLCSCGNAEYKRNDDSENTPLTPAAPEEQPTYYVEENPEKNEERRENDSKDYETTDETIHHDITVEEEHTETPGLEQTQIHEVDNEDSNTDPTKPFVATRLAETVTCVARAKPFEFELNISDIPIENIQVQCKENTLYIDAVNETNDGGVYSRTEIHRRVALPEDSDCSKARATVDGDMKLRLTVPTKYDTPEIMQIQIQHE